MFHSVEICRAVGPIHCTCKAHYISAFTQTYYSANHVGLAYLSKAVMLRYIYSKKYAWGYCLLYVSVLFIYLFNIYILYIYNEIPLTSTTSKNRKCFVLSHLEFLPEVRAFQAHRVLHRFQVDPRSSKTNGNSSSKIVHHLRPPCHQYYDRD